MSDHEDMRARGRDVWGFVAFSHGWTWTFWIVAALLGVSVWQMPATVFFVGTRAGFRDDQCASPGSRSG